MTRFPGDRNLILLLALVWGVFERCRASSGVG